MKDQYVGDINDFYKYGLLRALTAPGDIHVGLWWMLTADDGRSDGSLTGYLRNPCRYAPLDPELFSAMAAAVRSPHRSISSIERMGILPGALFDGATVPQDIDARRAAVDHMLARFAPVELVFFDPDMGVEVRSVRPGNLRSCQYVFWEEIIETVRRGHSALVFQYMPRRPRHQFVRHTMEQFAARLPSAAVSCTWTPRVAFFLAATRAHSPLAGRMEGFSRRWGLPILHGQTGTDASQTKCGAHEPGLSLPPEPRSPNPEIQSHRTALVDRQPLAPRAWRHHGPLSRETQEPRRPQPARPQ